MNNQYKISSEESSLKLDDATNSTNGMTNISANTESLKLGKQDDRTQATVVSSDESSYLSSRGGSMESMALTEVSINAESDRSIAWSVSAEGSVTSIDSLFQNEMYPDEIAQNETGILDDIVEICISMGFDQQDQFVYYCASAICVSRFFGPVEIILASIIVIFIKKETSPLIDDVISRLCRRFENTIMQPVRAKFDGRGLFSSQNTKQLETKIERIHLRNKNLRTKLESEQWMVKNLQHSLSRKDVILESEINNRMAIEQSSELVQALHDYENAQLIETVKRLEDEIKAQSETMVCMEKKAEQRDLLLANVVENFEKSGITVSKRGMKSAKYTSNEIGEPEGEERKAPKSGTMHFTDAQSLSGFT
jgi:hypothetical protein